MEKNRVDCSDTIDSNYVDNKMKDSIDTYKKYKDTVKTKFYDSKE
jgi:hypothetical protein